VESGCIDGIGSFHHDIDGCGNGNDGAAAWFDSAGGVKDADCKLRVGSIGVSIVYGES
jgi:hypothetical protein